jgi:uroporphyrinogen-III synthase
MGPITSQTARSLGMTVDVEAPTPTLDSFVQTIVTALRR